MEPSADANAPLAIFRKVNTLEGFFGLRAELFGVRSDSAEAAASVYVKGQLGMLTVAGRGGDVVDMHHVAGGLLLTRGPFNGGSGPIRTDSVPSAYGCV